MRACLRVCVCARARACVGRGCGCTSAGVCLLYLLIQYATRRRQIVCVFSGSSIFFDIIS